MERRPGFFDYGGAFMRFCQELAALVLTNILFLWACSPIVTVGPALLALTNVSLRRWREGRQRGTIRTFWEAFRCNLKQGIGLSIFLLVVGGALGLDLLWLSSAESRAGAILLGVMIAVSILLGMLLVYLLPVMCAGSLSLWEGACEAFRLAFLNWWRALTIMVAIVSVAALCVTVPVVFLTILPFLLLIGFSVPAFGFCVFLDETLPED